MKQGSRLMIILLLSPLVRRVTRFLLWLLFRKWRQYDSISLLSLETILETRERVPLLLALTRALDADKGRMTVARNLRNFQQVEPVFIKYFSNRDVSILEIGPGLLNPFAMAFLFLLHGYCSRYLGVEISDFRWDFALYGLNVLIDDVIREPQKFGFPSRTDAVKSLEKLIDFDALKNEDISRVFVGQRVKLFVYDGIHIDQLSSDIKNIDFVWCQSIFEHLRQPRALIERIPAVMKSDGIMYADIDFKDHFYRNKGKDEWSFLEHDTWSGSLNRLRAHEIIDGCIGDYFEILERTDNVKKLPLRRSERFSKRFRNMTDEQLSIISSRIVCKPL